MQLQSCCPYRRTILPSSWSQNIPSIPCIYPKLRISSYEKKRRDQSPICTPFYACIKHWFTSLDIWRLPYRGTWKRFQRTQRAFCLKATPNVFQTYLGDIGKEKKLDKYKTRKLRGKKEDNPWQYRTDIWDIGEPTFLTRQNTGRSELSRGGGSSY